MKINEVLRETNKRLNEKVQFLEKENMDLKNSFSRAADERNFLRRVLSILVEKMEGK